MGAIIYHLKFLLEIQTTLANYTHIFIISAKKSRLSNIPTIFELELELIQFNMTQKPMLRGEGDLEYRKIRAIAQMVPSF